MKITILILRQIGTFKSNSIEALQSQVLSYCLFDPLMYKYQRWPVALKTGVVSACAEAIAVKVQKAPENQPTKELNVSLLQ